MKKIGLVGGLTWISTSEYYREINQAVSTRLGRFHSARMVIESLDRQSFLDAADEDPSEGKCAEQIVDAVRTLGRTGAEVIALCANGIHRFENIIRERTGVEIVNIAAATARRVDKAKLTRVGLLGVMNTMEGRFFQTRLEQMGIGALVPEEADRKLLHHKIVTELVLGKFEASTRAEFSRVIRSLRDAGAQGVILGCTEIPLLLPASEIHGLPTFSTTHIHCAEIVRCALNEGQGCSLNDASPARQIDVS